MTIRLLAVCALLGALVVGPIRSFAQAERTVLGYTIAVAAEAATPFRQCLDLPGGPASVRISSVSAPPGTSVQARFGPQGHEKSLAIDGQSHAMTVSTGTVCLILQNTTVLPPGTDLTAVSNATVLLGVELHVLGDGPALAPLAQRQQSAGLVIGIAESLVPLP